MPAVWFQSRAPLTSQSAAPCVTTAALGSVLCAAEVAAGHRTRTEGEAGSSRGAHGLCTLTRAARFKARLSAGGWVSFPAARGEGM